MNVNPLLTRGVVEIIDKAHLQKALSAKKKLRVKLGIDPTSPDIHIGRAVVLWKLRAFQEQGHKIVFIVGDFTGLIGDTSDKEAERPMMTETEVRKNMATYFSQAFKIIDKSQTETHYNSKWLKKLGFKEIGALADLFGLHEFEARDVIARRLKTGKRVSLRELLYPLMQGYDSVAVKADVEIGGTDQRFNLLAGRIIQKHYGLPPQDIMTIELLAGTDGRKMSSSWRNVINIFDKPDEMFGKVMSLRDDLLERYFVLCTSLPDPEIKSFFTHIQNPRDLKFHLATEITSLYHGKQTAYLAAENFQKKFGRSSKGAIEDIKADHEIKKKAGSYLLVELLVEGELASSKSEARRKIQEGAVEVDGARIANQNARIQHKKTSLIRLGRKFLRIS